MICIRRRKIIIQSNKIETYLASVDLPEPEYKEKNKYHTKE